MIWKIVILLVAGNAAIAAAVVWAVVRWGWNRVPQRWPARAPAPDAVVRRYQSFRLGLINLGFSIHVSADEEHLHMEPIRPLRALGARPASIPWDEISGVKRLPFGPWATAKLAGRTLVGPAWCLELAAPDQEPVGGAADA